MRNVLMVFVAVVALYLALPIFAGVAEIGNRLGPRVYPIGMHELLYRVGWSLGSHSDSGKPRVEASSWHRRPWFYATGIAGPSAIGASILTGGRCLPAVVTGCKCVYSCANGQPRADGHFDVVHPDWKLGPLPGTIDRWCVGGQCTEAFHVDMICTTLCAAKAADPTCHFDSHGSCVGVGGR